MTRYISPARMGLLCLLELYTEEFVPNEARISVLYFLTAHMIEGVHGFPTPEGCDPDNTPPNERWSRVDNTIRIVTSLADFERLLAPYEAVGKVSPGRRLWDLFVRKLWIIDCVDSMHIFFRRLEIMLARSKRQMRRMVARGIKPPGPEVIRLRKHSLLGNLVRKSAVEFFRLKFHDVTALWQDYVRYRQPTMARWRRLNPRFVGSLSFDSMLYQNQIEWGCKRTGDIIGVAYGDMLRDDDLGGGRLSVSTNEVEVLIEFQIGQLQKYGNRVPAGLFRRFRVLLQDVALRPSLAHYLLFLEAWRAGDYNNAFDCLHRYFDYTMHTKNRVFYQYALLNLAVLLADFGSHRDALDSMLEAVNVARENHDATCLNFALNWLYHFSTAHPDLLRNVPAARSLLEAAKENLRYLRLKSQESGMWTLCISSLLSEAKLALAAGAGIPDCLDYIVRSSTVLVEHNMKSLWGGQLTLSTIVWDRLGVGCLAQLSCELFVMCDDTASGESVFEDEMKVTCRLAGILVSQGEYDRAKKYLKSLKNRDDFTGLRSVRMNQYWQRYRGLIQLRRDMHRQNFDGAEYLIRQLLQQQQQHQRGGNLVDNEVALAVDTLHVELLSRRGGDLSAAFAKVEEMIVLHYESAEPIRRDVSVLVKLILLKASLYDQTGRPERGFSLALRAASLAWRHRLVPLLWQAVGAVANVLNALGHFDAASVILLRALPRALENETGNLVSAQLYSYLADSQLGMSGELARREQEAIAAGSGWSSSSDSDEEEDPAEVLASMRIELMVRATFSLDAACSLYALLEAVDKMCEVRAKQATIAKALHEHGAAAEFAAQFMTLKKAIGPQRVLHRARQTPIL